MLGSSSITRKVLRREAQAGDYSSGLAGVNRNSHLNTGL